MAIKKIKGLVMVESPAKARKIGGYLGKEYTVMASMGHVRDLPANASEIPEEIKKQKKPWASLGVNVDQGFAPLLRHPQGKTKDRHPAQAALKDASELILATDEDREGESIGWHLSQILKPKVPVKRMVFSEITKEAIQDAIQHTRKLDTNLVEARKPAGSSTGCTAIRSARCCGKRSPAAFRPAACNRSPFGFWSQRELERLAFHSGTYWDLRREHAVSGQAAATATAESARVHGGRRSRLPESASPPARISTNRPAD